ncbi:MAG: alpha/beta hydrolase [Hydrogenophaga sp.]|nr:alpha/beta hydrolase [Hydrogenophaga sp.]
MSACAAPSPQARSAGIAAWAAGQGWQARVLPGPGFDIQAFAPTGLPATERLTVYIEGDGLAWLDRHTPSFAPTPSDPLGLRLAMADAGARAVYLARPCQYTQGAAFKGCDNRYWGSHRFAPDVIAAMDHAVDGLKREHGASELVLVGYSGGAAVAALLAARRSDVVALVTVAGVLDADRWTREQRLLPLTGSLDPKDVSARLASIPQWHFVGDKDAVVPASVLAGFLEGVARSGVRNAPTPVVRSLAGFDHGCCWAQAWPELSRLFARPEARR